jgi:hypothetical protein
MSGLHCNYNSNHSNEHIFKFQKHYSLSIRAIVCENTWRVSLVLVFCQSAESTVVVAAERVDDTVLGQAEGVHPSGTNGHHRFAIQRGHDLQLPRFHHIRSQAQLKIIVTYVMISWFAKKF